MPKSFLIKNMAIKYKSESDEPVGKFKNFNQLRNNSKKLYYLK
jgi:hypothetical protein